VPSVLPSEVVSLVVLVNELMQLDPVSSKVSEVAIEISDALWESLSTIHAWYFRDNDKGNRNLAEECDHLREDMRTREWDLAHLCECSQEHLYYREDVTFE
jgi:hypothetical protein